ncbi:hypothetical protein D0C36_08945 [Mucilaginibacter conchicola]|uniref:Tetratricopeptide repeat protein n=1 Tax=Mucilaginibacter conchicola TaxID=2303333 RepID=A0A372NZS7_9SPHI|nr:hypothetical protein [Mucilaginibacter conchicola]RFZ95626.1 hypothetical protein D0C36_08945 [Mucilaginibacter conchicola]
MLLGSNAGTNPVTKDRPTKSETELIATLISQSRYAEAYLLLKNEATDNTATQYNLALCLYWAGSYREALMSLDKAQLFMPVNTGSGKTNPATDSFYKAIREKQNGLDDHRNPVTQKNIELTTQMVADGIVRLKTDCWLQLGEYARVIDIATPIAYKNYLNIFEALTIAKQHLNK